MNTNLGEFFMDRKITLLMILICKSKMSSFRLLLAGLLKFHTETSMHATIQLEFSENSNAHMALENSRNCNLWARARKTEHTHWGPKPHNVCSVFISKLFHSAKFSVVGKMCGRRGTASVSSVQHTVHRWISLWAFLTYIYSLYCPSMTTIAYLLFYRESNNHFRFIKFVKRRVGKVNFFRMSWNESSPRSKHSCNAAHTTRIG